MDSLTKPWQRMFTSLPIDLLMVKFLLKLLDIYYSLGNNNKSTLLKGSVYREHINQA